MLVGRPTCLYAGLLDLDHEIARGNAIANNRCLTASHLAVQGARDCILCMMKSLFCTAPLPFAP